MNIERPNLTIMDTQQIHPVISAFLSGRWIRSAPEDSTPAEESDYLHAYWQGKNPYDGRAVLAWGFGSAMTSDVAILLDVLRRPERWEVMGAGVCDTCGKPIPAAPEALPIDLRAIFAARGTCTPCCIQELEKLADLEDNE